MGIENIPSLERSCSSVSSNRHEEFYNIETLQKQLLHLESSYKHQDITIITKRKELTTIIEDLQSDNKSLKDFDLHLKLEEFSELINKEIVNEIRKSKKNNLERVFDTLYFKYGLINQRLNLTRNDELEYFRELNNVLLQTRLGSYTHSCFFDPKYEHKVKMIKKGRWMFYAYNSLNGKRLKEISLNLRFSPINAVITLAHEYLHSCLDSYVDQIYPEGISEDNLTPEQERLYAIDELRANFFQELFFKELAQIAPRYVCNLIAPAWTEQHIFESQFRRREYILRDLKSGVKAYELMVSYTKNGLFNESSIFSTTNKKTYSLSFLRVFKEEREREREADIYLLDHISLIL
ncbi:hypothetical protein N9W41_00540 [bacterium]|nr:hypothetical protein [bacterium]